MAAFGADFDIEEAEGNVVPGAPSIMPPEVEALFTALPLYTAQIQGDIEFEHDDQQVLALALQNVRIAKAVMSPVGHMTGLAISPQNLLDHLIVVLPDTRDIPDPPSKDPVAAHTEQCASMVLFQVCPFRADPNKASWENNTIWSLRTIANRLVQTRPAIVIPPVLVASYEQIQSMYIAFDSLLKVFKDVVLPPGAIIAGRTGAGTAVHPNTAAATNAAAGPLAPRLGGMTAEQAAIETAKAAQTQAAKEHAKDSRALAMFRGMSEQAGSLMKNSMPLLADVRFAVSAKISSVLPSCHLTSGQLNALIEGNLGSALGITRFGQGSVTMFAVEGRAVRDFETLVDLFQRLKQIAPVVYGPASATAFQTLQNMLVTALTPTVDHVAHTEIGMCHVVDIANAFIMYVANDQQIAAHQPGEKWGTIVANIRDLPVWKRAVIEQAVRNTQTTIYETLQQKQRLEHGQRQEKLHRSGSYQESPRPTLGRSSSSHASTSSGRGAESKGPHTPSVLGKRETKRFTPVQTPPHVREAIANSSPSTMADPTSSRAGHSTAQPPPRCRMQDAAGGCTYGERCAYLHDKDDKSGPNTTQPRGGGGGGGGGHSRSSSGRSGR